MRRNRHPNAAGVLARIDGAVAAQRSAPPKRLQGNHDAPLASSVEARFRNEMVSRGWDVHRSGWPDFALTKNGELLLVEVKGVKDRLRKAQVSLFSAFEAKGIDVRIWWVKKPDLLLPWRRFMLLTDPARVGSSLGSTGSDQSKVTRVK